MAEDGRFIELQGTAEDEPFDMNELQAMLSLGQKGTSELLEIQRRALDGDD